MNDAINARFQSVASDFAMLELKALSLLSRRKRPKYGAGGRRKRSHRKPRVMYVFDTETMPLHDEHEWMLPYSLPQMFRLGRVW